MSPLLLFSPSLKTEIIGKRRRHNLNGKKQRNCGREDRRKLRKYENARYADVKDLTLTFDIQIRLSQFTH